MASSQMTNPNPFGRSIFPSQSVSTKLNYAMRLLQTAFRGPEESLIDEVYQQYGYQNRWKIVDYMHTLPEWQDPHGSSVPIPIRQILEAAGEDEDEIRAVIRELRAISAAEETLSSVS
jgi:hypothetical protein